MLPHCVVKCAAGKSERMDLAGLRLSIMQLGVMELRQPLADPLLATPVAGPEDWPAGSSKPARS